MKEKVMQGKPYAGNPHVRFDEGADAPKHSGRSALLYKNMQKTIGFAAKMEYPPSAASPRSGCPSRGAFPVRAARWSAPTAAALLCTIHHAFALQFVYKPACGGGPVFCIMRTVHRRNAMRHQVGCAEMHRRSFASEGTSPKATRRARKRVRDRRAENIESAKGVQEHNK